MEEEEEECRLERAFSNYRQSRLTVGIERGHGLQHSKRTRRN